jgi:competence protein ComEA
MGATATPIVTGQPTARPALLAGWPRSVQIATAALLGLAMVVLAVRSFDHLWSRLRSTEPPSGANVAYQIDLNMAGRAELLQVPGIGESLAQRILDYRREHGGFRRIEDLRRVRGIGPITLEKLRPWVCVSEPEEMPTENDMPASRNRLALVSDRRVAGSATTTTGKKLTLDDAPLDLNRATKEELMRLPGIGPKLAEAIVAEREKKPLASVEELRRVKGIGPKTLEKVRPFVLIGSERVQVAATERE